MSAFEMDGSRKRVAHQAANSNTDLIKSLAAKKSLFSLGRMGASGSNVNNKKPASPKKIYPLFAPSVQIPTKRRKVNGSSSEEDNPKRVPPKPIQSQQSQANRFGAKNNLTTFSGNSFSSAVGKMAEKMDTRRIPIESESDNEDDEPGWLSKATAKKIHGTKPVSKRKIKLPPAPKSNFLVNRRAVLSSSSSDFVTDGTSEDDEDEEEEEDEEDSFESEKGKGAINRKKNGAPVVKKTSRRAQIVSDEDEEEETPSSSSAEDDEQDQKKSLKELAQRAKKVSEKQKRRNRRQSNVVIENGDTISDDHQDSDGDDDMESSDIDSDESDAKERKTTKSMKKQKEIEEKCLQLINNASIEELNGTEKFSQRLLKSIGEKRPFDNYNSLRSMFSKIGRGISQLDQYLEFLENRGILEQVLDDCKQHVSQIKEELTKLESGNLSLQPALLNPELSLHPYQHIGLQWLIMMNKLELNAILGDEMGLGKTIQIIAFLAWAKEQPDIKGPHLIIVPSSTIENWMNEIRRWCSSMKVLTYYGSIEQRAQLRQRASSRNIDVILTTYNMVISRVEDRNFFKRFSINYVIYDEGHMLRTCTTLRYRNLMRIQGQRKILLTGTPLQNNLIELISLLFFTMTNMFTRYCDDIAALLQMFARKGKMLDNKKAGKFGRKAKREEDDDDPMEEDVQNGAEEDGPLYERHKIAQAKSILQPFILRRLKTQVLVTLPKKHEKIVVCPITDVQEELYGYVMDDLLEEKESGSVANYISYLMQMRQTANHPLLYRKNFDDYKLREMAKLLCIKERQYKEKNPDHVAEDLSFQTDIMINSLCRKFRSMRPYELDKKLSLDSGKCKQLDVMLPEITGKGEKVLIFSQFTTLLDILELYMDFRGYKYCRLDGSTPVMERQELINLFNHDESIPVFLLSTKAGGLGINLTAANHIILHDIDFNPYNDKQAEDRCHRMGQTKEVYVTRLISKDTIEESILVLAQKKLKLEKDVTGADSQANPDEEQRLDSKIVEDMLTQALAKCKARRQQ